MHLVNCGATYEKAMITTKMRRFQGKTTVVTGASRGIGRAIAVRLASEGAFVVINYAKGADARYPGAAEETLRQVQAAGGQGSIYEADVADTDAIRNILRQT